MNEHKLQYDNLVKNFKTNLISALKQSKNLCLSLPFSQPQKIMKCMAEFINRNDYSFNLYYCSSEIQSKNYLIDYDLLLSKKINASTFLIGKNERKIIKKSKNNSDPKLIHYLPVNLSEYAYVLNQIIKIDFLTLTTTNMDSDGYFNLGIDAVYTHETIAGAKFIFVEVNENMPYLHGENHKIHISKINGIVENNIPLLEQKLHQNISEKEIQIAQNILEKISNDITLQIDLGIIPDYILSQLTNHENIKIYTPILTDGVINLVKKWNDQNKKRKEPIEVKFTYVMASEKSYHYINKNPVFQIQSGSSLCLESNIAKNEKMVSINSCYEINLRGECNVEHLNNHQFSGIFAKFNFCKGTNYAKYGKSFFYHLSTAKNNSISKIVPNLKFVASIPRNEIDYVVTEYGAISLKGKNSSQRSSSLISLAHPKYRSELTVQAKKMNIL